MANDETSLRTVHSEADDALAERPTPRRTLDRRTILREAVRFIDEFGREQLTMRRLGAELGVEALLVLVLAGTSLSIESWGLCGRWRAGAVGGRS